MHHHRWSHLFLTWFLPQAAAGPSGDVRDAASVSDDLPVVKVHGRLEDVARLAQAADARLLPVGLTHLSGCDPQALVRGTCTPVSMHTAFDRTGQRSVVLGEAEGKSVILARGDQDAVAWLQARLVGVRLVRTTEIWCAGGGCAEAWIPVIDAPCIWERVGREVVLSKGLPEAVVSTLCMDHGVSVFGPAGTIAGSTPTE